MQSQRQFPGYLDTKRREVFWVYPSVSKGGSWSVVYNYHEKEWSERDPALLSAFYDAPRYPQFGFLNVDSYGGLINSASQNIDSEDDSPARLVPQISANYVATIFSHQLFSVGALRLKPAAGQFSHKVETADFFWENFANVHEVTKVVVDFLGAGSPNLTVKVGSRKNQTAPITWSSAVGLTQSDGSFSFFVRSEGIGKYLRFRFEWNNSADNYITEMLLASFVKVDSVNPDNDDTK